MLFVRGLFFNILIADYDVTKKYFINEKLIFLSPHAHSTSTHIHHTLSLCVFLLSVPRIVVLITMHVNTGVSLSVSRPVLMQLKPNLKVRALLKRNSFVKNRTAPTKSITNIIAKTWMDKNVKDFKLCCKSRIIQDSLESF